MSQLSFMCSQSECQLEKPDWTYFSSFIKTVSFMGGVLGELLDIQCTPEDQPMEESSKK
jgi:hypothetical protein